MQFVDANIFIRYLTKDDVEKANACYALFKRAERDEIALTTSEAVITEVVYVLSSRKTYGLPSQEIRALLYPLLSVPGLKLAQRRTYLRALDYFAQHHVDFEDALTVAHMERQKLTEILTYDRDFDRFPVIKRLEPTE